MILFIFFVDLLAITGFVCLFLLVALRFVVDVFNLSPSALKESHSISHVV